MVGYLSKKTGPVRFLPVPAYPTHTRALVWVPPGTGQRAAGTDGQGRVYPTRVTRPLPARTRYPGYPCSSPGMGRVRGYGQKTDRTAIFGRKPDLTRTRFTRTRPNPYPTRPVFFQKFKIQISPIPNKKTRKKTAKKKPTKKPEKNSKK